MAKKRVSLQEINKKINEILQRQKKLMKLEKQVSSKEEEQIEELEKLEEFEKEIKKEVGKHPLAKITLRDIAKGAIGSFFGIGAHYTFYYGVKIAKEINMTRAIIIFILSYLVGAVFLYLTGYRRLKIKTIAFLPLRLTVLYLTAITTSFLLLNLFEPHFLSSFEHAFKALATVTLSATIGACTADLIGRGE
ncbi:hypothetical protein B6U93_02705 [Candidatus Woesearchaeota archaeon ex4484_78]|nr:MAG: hypothetical protein B6U93_02705 [Candidatus Woesearchaeota archaeon ex4484_78]